MDVSTVTVIGMPGTGKSTVGVLLAKRLGLAFSDVDLLIQAREGELLQATLERVGYLALRAIEEAVILDMPLENRLVATGGSAVYSDAAMQRLGAAGPRVFLQTPLEQLRERVARNPDRGIACPPGQSLEDVFEERVPLYRRYADITVDCAALASAEDVASAVLDALPGRRGS
ncbi:MAG: shikimate kinase [Halieaceae bacterium]|jgi:shikimate kinase|nr:shikimate kinase [Halieaceae bacterium]